LSFSIETLHDFVLNILNDEAAKAAYAADPVGALKDAGLADLTPADVQEALPLVADSLPTDLPVGDLPIDLPAGVPSLGDLPLDLPSLPAGLPVDGLGDLSSALPVNGLPALGDLSSALPVDGLSGLGGLTSSLPVNGLSGLGDLSSSLPVDGLPVVGDLPIAAPADGLPMDGLPALGGLPTGVPSLGDLPNVPVELPSIPTLETPLGDVTTVVDGVGGLAGVGADTDLLDNATAGLLSNPGEGDAPTLSTHTESVLGDLAAGAKLAPEEFGGSIAGSSDLADVGGGVVGHVGGDLGAWGGADTVAGDLAGGVQVGPSGLAVGAESPLGNVAFNSDGDFSIQPANTSDLLDVDHLGTTGDTVIGTVAHYVSTGSDVLADGVSSGSGALGGYLTGSAAPLGDTLDSTTDTVTDGIRGGGDQVSEHLSNLPTTDALPLDQLPELPKLPDLPDVNSSDLPAAGGLAGHLPVDLPSVQLPDTSAVTDLVSHNPVTDAVHSSPVGGLVDGVTGHLPQVGDHLPAVGDLDLGL
jgi:hypothetical protein